MELMVGVLIVWRVVCVCGVGGVCGEGGWWRLTVVDGNFVVVVGMVGVRIVV